MALVLAAFTFCRRALNLAKTKATSRLSFPMASLGVSPSAKSVMSSANTRPLVPRPSSFKPSSSGAAIRLYKVGLRGLPCGSPLVTGYQALQSSFHLTLLHRLPKNALIHLRRLSHTPRLFSCPRTPLCHTPSKACEMSTATATTHLPRFHDECTLCCSSARESMGPAPALNPVW